MYPYFLFPGVSATGKTSYYDSYEGHTFENRRGEEVSRIGVNNRASSEDHEVPELPGGGSRTGTSRITLYTGYGTYIHRDGDPGSETGGSDASYDDNDDRRGMIYDRVGSGEVYEDQQRTRSQEGRRIDIGIASGNDFSSSSSASSFSSSSSSFRPDYSNQAKHDHASSTDHQHQNPQSQHPQQKTHDLEQHKSHHRQHQGVPYTRHRDRQQPNRHGVENHYDYPEVMSERNHPALAHIPSSSPNLEAPIRVAHPAPPPSWHWDKNYGTKAHAPRPTYYYERGVVVGRFDHDYHFDNNGSSLPLDRLFDLREAFEGFVDQGMSNSGSLGGSDIDGTIPRQPVRLVVSSTCHHAYTMCRNDTECRSLLQLVLDHCDVSNCARNECMNALQHFYKKANHKHSMEIAFCLCKKTEDKRDECIVAQEKMHPACAQRVELAEMPTCHSLAEVCREEKSCRNKLEHYEQSCAVDSVTKKCAGPPGDCRKAMLGILGTELRSNCACKGPDFVQLYVCLGWQRLLWVNPCVVESQKDYHVRNKHHHYVHQHPKTTSATPLVSATTTTATTYLVTTLEGMEPVEDNVIPEVTRVPTWQPTSTTESTTIAPSTTPSTTTTMTTSPRFCVVQRPRQSHQYIREGKGKRLYRDDEPECSELCQCGEGEVLVCNTICVEFSPCKTDFAFYNHAAPAYQAYRGRCLCYSGRFICMRPLPEAYDIPHGVFMFLGYSEADEMMLRPHSNLTVVDAVNSLDKFMREELNNQTVCTLFLYNVTRENVIAVARLGGNNPPSNSSQAQTLQHLLRVKEQCSAMLQDLSDKINSKHQEVHTHPLLSIFKMAEVEIKLPQAGYAGQTTYSSWLLVLTGSIACLVSQSGISSSKLHHNEVVSRYSWAS